MTKANEKTDYSNGKIYVIISPNHDLFYYGSTTLTIEQRFSLHKSQRDCTSKKIIDAGDAEIFEIESYPCLCLEELEDREAFYIVNDWDGSVNETVPGAMRRAGGKKEYMKIINAKPERKEYMKAYSEKPEQKTKRKLYDTKPENKKKRKVRESSQIPCNVCGCYIRRGGKSRHQRSKTCQTFLKNELNDLMNDMITQIEQINDI